MRVLLAMVAASLALVASAAHAGVSAPAAEVERVAWLEDGILDEVNELRARRGLPALTISKGLRGAALAHARDQLTAGVFQHDSVDGTPFGERLRRFYPSRGWGEWSVGENLIMSTGEILADQAVDAWLKSPPHRRTLLAPVWRDVGIAALAAPHAGGAWHDGPGWIVTMDFGARTQPRSLSQRRTSSR